MELKDYLALKNKRKRPHAEESGIQIRVANYLRHNYPGALFTIAPSGMKLGIRTAQRFKAMGYRQGTPDMLIFEPRGGFYGLFLELKTDKGKLSDSQRDFIALLIDRNYKVMICYGYDEAVRAIEAYFKK